MRCCGCIGGPPGKDTEDRLKRAGSNPLRGCGWLAAFAPSVTRMNRPTILPSRSRNCIDRLPPGHHLRALGRQLAGISPHIRAGLDSTNHGRNVFFEVYYVLTSKLNCRPAALSGLDYDDLVNVYQHLSRGRSWSFQHTKNGHLRCPLVPTRWLRHPSSKPNNNKKCIGRFCPSRTRLSSMRHYSAT